MNDRLHFVMPAIAANEQIISSRIIRSGDAANVGRTVMRPAFYELYLVNESRLSIDQVEVAAEKLAEEGSELTKRFSSTLGRIKSGGALLIEQLDLDSLDSTLCYKLQLSFVDGLKQRATFSFNREVALYGSQYRYFHSLSADAHRISIGPERIMLGDATPITVLRREN